MAAQEAHLERQQALRLEREQAAQAQVMQQQAMQRRTTAPNEARVRYDERAPV